LEAKRDALLYVPRGYRADRPAPLAVALHGAGGNAVSGLRPLRRFADTAGLLLLAPASRGPTWDVVYAGQYGPDVAFIDRALLRVFDRYAVDPARVAVSGFSDGATYALSLGLANGDLFKRVVAFSPGFVAPAARHGKPYLFIAHGTNDRVLLIDHASRRLVPELRSAGYSVRYREFKGDHTVPSDVARDAAGWLTGRW
jgi:phospholipase/carboxylesterase